MPMKTEARPFLLLVVLVGVLVVLATAPAAARQSVCLDGEWECVWGEAGTPPGAGAGWAAVRVPSTWQWNAEGPHCLWYRTLFFVPMDWVGQRVFVRLDGVKYGQRVYVNGVELGGHDGGYEPMEYEVTGQVRFGKKNELVVGAKDWTSLIAEGAEVGSPSTSGEFASWVTDGVLAPIGSRGWEVGIWESVWLEARPAVWVADVFAAPSVRERKLRAEVTVRNGGGLDARTTVSLRVAEGGPGPSFAPQEVELGAGEETTVEFEADWFDARLWWPEDPHLYTLVAGARTGTAGDSKEARFGFREFWTEGDRLILNGGAINLLATAAHPMAEYDGDPEEAYAIAKEAGCVAMRLHAQPWPQQWYEAADESGMLLVWESALWCLSPQYALTKDEFWENAREHVTAQVKRQRNHPSIVIWSAENELLMCGAAAVEGGEEKVVGLGDAIRSVDGTRPVMFDGDGDPGGTADIVNLHYPHELPQWNLWPETAYWFDAPVELDTYPGGVWQWDRTKPLYLGEFLWMPPGTTDAGSVLFGDGAYPGVDTSRQLAKAATWEMQVIGARDAGVNGLCPWNLWEMGSFPNPGSEAHRRAYQPLAAFVREANRRVFAGTVVERTITVLNDTRQTRSLELRWRLRAEGKLEAAGSAAVTVEPAGRERVRAELALPASDREETNATFVVELWEGGQRVFGDSQEWKVYGRGGLSGRVRGAPARVAVYDPDGATARLLDKLGIETLKIDEGNVARMLHWAPVAVVGKGAFERPAGRAVVGGGGDGLLGALLRFVRGGGTLVVFEQEYYPPELIPVSLTEHDSTIAFARRPEHPALEGVEEADLAHWLHDGLVGRNEIAKPAAGGFVTVVDSGGAAGLATAGLAELRVGKGRMLLCQLEVTRKFGADPVATKLARNLLAYASERPAGPVVAGVVCDDEAAEVLDGIGLRYDRLELPLRVEDLRQHPVLVLRDVEEVTGQARLLREYVRQGGRVVLHNVRPEMWDAAQRLVGEAVSVERGCDGWVSLVDRGGPAAGLSNEDLAWFAPGSGNMNVARSLSGEVADAVVMRPARVVGASTMVEGEEMAMAAAAGAIVRDERGLSAGLYSNGELTAPVSLGAGGYSLISVRARGTALGGVYPRVVVRVDGAAVGSVAVSGETWETLGVVAALPGGEHTLGVAFENDENAPPEDRNLWVDWVSWAPAELVPTRVRFHTYPGVLASVEQGRGMWVMDQVRWDKTGASGEKAARYVGTLLTNLGCEFRHEAGTVIEAGAMEVTECPAWAREGDAIGLWANGVVEAEVEFEEAGEYEFGVRARGTALGGVYPRVEVRVDGETVGEVELTSAGWQRHRTRAAVAEGVHRVGLAFVNDEYDPPEDRNLTISDLSIVRSE